MGNLAIHHFVINSIPEVVGRITGAITRWDPPGYQKDPRPLQIVQSKRKIDILDDLSGRDLTTFSTLSHILEYRATQTPEKQAYILLDSRGREAKRVCYKKFSQKIYSLAHFLIKKKNIQPGEYVIVMTTVGLEFIYTIHACLYCGIIPIPIR